jgi:hypothetical protein
MRLTALLFDPPRRAPHLTARHVRYQFWPFSVHVEKFVGIG